MRGKKKTYKMFIDEIQNIILLRTIFPQDSSINEKNEILCGEGDGG